MPDIAGAMKAIEDRFVAEWNGRTNISFDNDGSEAWRDDQGQPTYWVKLQVENEQSEIVGAGKPGQHVNQDEGQILITVSAPNGAGQDTAREHAVAAGEIFRTAVFYDQVPGFYVRTWKPHVGRAVFGRSENPEGLWYVITVTIPFEFWSIA